MERLRNIRSTELMAECLAFSFGYSTFELDLDYLRTHKLIDRQSISEIREEQMLERIYRRQIKAKPIISLIARICAFILLFKSAYLLYLTHSYYNFLDRQQRIQLLPSRGGGSLSQITCIHSDCPHSYLTGTRQVTTRLLAMEKVHHRLDEVPILAICEPLLRHLYEPMAHFYGASSLLYLCAVSFSFVMFFVLVQLQTMFPTRNSMITFVVAPHLTGKLLRHRAHTYLADIGISLMNYSNTVDTLRQREEALQLEALRWGDGSDSPNGFELMRLPIRSLKSERADAVDFRPSMSGQSDAEFVEDSLPMVRTRWWRTKLVKLFNLALIQNLATCVFVPVGLLAYTTFELSIKYDHLSVMAHEMRAMNCSMWRHGSHGDSSNQQLIDLTALDLGWNWLTIPSVLTIALWPCFVMTLGLFYRNIGMWELRCWVCELKFKFISLTPLIKALVQASKLGGNTGRQQRRTSNNQIIYGWDKRARLERATYCSRDPQKHYQVATLGPRTPTFPVVTSSRVVLSQLNRKFEHDIGAGPLVVADRSYSSLRRLRENQNHLVRNCFTQPSTHLVEGGGGGKQMALIERELMQSDGGRVEAHQIEVLVELLEKLYINFNLLADLAHELTNNITPIILVFVVNNYGVTMICVWVMRAIGELTVEPFLVMVLNFFSPILMIANSAALYSRTKQLVQLVRAMIAELALCDHRRVQHIRSLWLKQMDVVESQKGLAVSPFNLSFTYVNMIQLSIWTGTLLVFAMRY